MKSTSLPKSEEPQSPRAPVLSRRKVIQIYVALTLVSLLAFRSFFIKNPTLKGYTMGTTYSVKIGGYMSRSTLMAVERDMDEALAEISRQMSTWDPASELSRINHSEECGPFALSTELAEVVERALTFSEATDRAFDPTLQPLMNLWGFGSEGIEKRIPSEEEIDAVWGYTGPDTLLLQDGTNLLKGMPEVQIDLGAIAKGYGVDTLSALLNRKGFDNWFVEIGGEVAVRGRNPDNQPWSIGIQYPSTNPVEHRLQCIVHLTEGAVATSGDYRNYIEQDGKIYSHIFNPHAGRPVLSDTASVTVYAPSCMDADATATALFVMGPEKGLSWVEEKLLAEAMFLIRGENGEMIEQFSSKFKEVTGYESTNENP